MSRNTTSANNLLLIFLIVTVIATSECTASVAGKYVSEKNARNYLELKSDGTFYLHEGFTDFAGKYEVEGSQITLKTEMGFASRGTIEGKTLIDKDGVRWTKQ